MKILLDENFPLRLHHRLVAAGHDAEHIILLGQRGIPDAWIRSRLEAGELLFLTQDEEFMSLPPRCRATIIVSRVDQSRPIRERVDLWFRAVEKLLADRPKERLFEVLDSGELVPWQVLETAVYAAKGTVS